jgi:hypothetical protein
MTSKQPTATLLGLSSFQTPAMVVDEQHHDRGHPHRTARDTVT